MRFRCAASGDGQSVVLAFDSEMSSVNVMVPASGGAELIAALQLEFAKAAGIAVAIKAQQIPAVQAALNGMHNKGEQTS